jgi:ribose 5-phosphate isomerase A
MSRELKIAAAQAALDHVADGMLLGIGTGSTAEEFVTLLAERVAGGLKITGVATSERTEALCRRLGVPMTTLDAAPELDLTVDGADEIGPKLALIKGGGGALLREKIVAAASKRMLVIADQSKLVEQLGAYPLPIEVNSFGLAATVRAIGKAALKLGLDCAARVRQRQDRPFVSDGGHLIVDASFGLIPDAEALSLALLAIPGVVEHGLFIGMADTAIIAGQDGVRTISV